MKRKQVVVANQVFDLGLQSFEESVANRDGKWPMLELEVCGTVFQVGVSRLDKAVMLNWWGITNIRNIIWTRFVFLMPRWPLFTYAREEDGNANR